MTLAYKWVLVSNTGSSTYEADRLGFSVRDGSHDLPFSQDPVQATGTSLVLNTFHYCPFNLRS